MQRTKYAAEFKSEAVKQVVDKGHAVVDVAKRQGVPEGVLYSWVNKFKKSEAPQSSDLKALQPKLCHHPESHCCPGNQASRTAVARGLSHCTYPKSKSLKGLSDSQVKLRSALQAVGNAARFRVHGVRAIPDAHPIEPVTQAEA